MRHPGGLAARKPERGSRFSCVSRIDTQREIPGVATSAKSRKFQVIGGRTPSRYLGCSPTGFARITAIVAGESASTASTPRRAAAS